MSLVSQHTACYLGTYHIYYLGIARVDHHETRELTAVGREILQYAWQASPREARSFDRDLQQWPTPTKPYLPYFLLLNSLLSYFV